MAHEVDIALIPADRQDHGIGLLGQRRLAGQVGLGQTDRSGDQNRARRDRKGQSGFLAGNVRLRAVEHVQRRLHFLGRSAKDHNVLGVEHPGHGPLVLRAYAVVPGVQLVFAVGGRLVIGGLLSFIEQQFLIHIGMNNCDTGFPLDFRAIDRDVVQIGARIEIPDITDDSQMFFSLRVLFDQ